MLVTCAAYQDGKKLAEITKREIHEYLHRPNCFVWVALRDAGDEELLEMQEEFGLPDLAVEGVRHGHERPKIEEYGDSLFAVLHIVEKAGDELSVGELDIFVGRNYVLLVRNRAERGFADVRARCENEPDLLRHGAGYVLYALMDSVVDRYFPVLDTLEAQLEQTEEQLFAGKTPRANIEALYSLKQKLMVLKHATAPLLEVASKLFGGRVPYKCSGLGDYFRDVYDHLFRLNQTIDATREMVTTALTVSLSLVQLQENETTKRLASYAALIAVPTMIAGIYGMNFEHMPELKWPIGYPLTLGVMFVLDVYLFYRLRKAGWL